MVSKSPSGEIAVKLADFGLSTIVHQDQLPETNCGTLTYVAPEIIQGGGYGREVDMWSCGVIIYVLLCGYPPFYGNDDKEMLDMTLRGKFEFLSPDWDSISGDAKDLITKLIRRDRATRATAKMAMNHPWFAPLKSVGVSSAKPSLVEEHVLNARLSPSPMV